jgi:hypothetical protein
VRLVEGGERNSGTEKVGEREGGGPAIISLIATNAWARRLVFIYPEPPGDPRKPRMAWGVRTKIGSNPDQNEEPGKKKWSRGASWGDGWRCSKSIFNS